MSNKPKELVDLLMSGESLTTGSYNHLTWEINQGQDAASASAKLTSIHESLHADLNDASAYGLVLITVAYLARESSESRYLDLLEALVNRCRDGHETYATYVSCLAMNVDGNGEVDRQLLDGYHNYHRYIDLAEQMLPGLKGEFVKKHALGAIIKVCFHVNWVQSLIDKGIAQFSVDDLQATDFPDQRMQSLLSVLNADYWRESLSLFIEQTTSEFVGTDAQPALLSLVSGAYRYDALDTQLYDSLSAKLTAHLESAITTSLVGLGLRSLEGPQHLDLLPDLMAQANQIFSFDKAKEPLRIESQPMALTAQSLRSFDNEILRIDDQKLGVELLEFEYVAREHWEDYLTVAGELTYFFIISRAVERLKQHYSFSEADLKILADRKVVVAIRKLTHDEYGCPVVQLVLFNKPGQIRLLDKICKQAMLANSSFLMLFYKPWLDIWLEELELACTHTLLFDLSPFAHLERTLPALFDQVQVQKYAFKDGEHTRSALALVGRGDTTSVFIIPCSDMCASAIVYYINEVLNPCSSEGEIYVLERPDAEISKCVIGPTLTHLYREEILFDFAALQTHFAKQAMDSGELEMRTI